MMNLKEIAHKVWGNLEAIVSALDYDPCEELAARVERLERAIADLGKKSETSA